jgi:hypothetical protein
LPISGNLLDIPPIFTGFNGNFTSLPSLLDIDTHYVHSFPLVRLWSKLRLLLFDIGYSLLDIGYSLFEFKL